MRIAKSSELFGQVRRVSSQYGGVGLVVVDYLQLMALGADSRANMTERVGEISWGLKKLACIFGCASTCSIAVKP
ncbi:hypothetical protein H6G94_33180 [Nostoc punctiforme FACHB-252]|uniref:SF4 helicase domain-containing protein n=1 Tax=Nostoc punctiforme FACHB-252 TaxID=1357509 RepID=A0ABR8HKK6_NOSPU|nr:DnaB-like helicase C-terminal domain-containing protein [Nostoc punctiforme]MBD2616043.1 hypothetical protein [Nostoc punctiforme FACHB-252]